jgi:hypothetical protein
MGSVLPLVLRYHNLEKMKIQPRLSVPVAVQSGLHRVSQV